MQRAQRGTESYGTRLQSLPVPDDTLLLRFQHDPKAAWDEFLDRYADVMFRHLQRLRFDYDDAMDCFTYVCEKLAEQDFRRLRGVRHTGKSGELTPWLLKVVERFSVSWIWSRDGRKRMFKPVGRLSARDQRVFELHFRAGLSPLAILEQLRIELHEEVSPGQVFDALERIHNVLSPNKRWRLLSNLARARGPASLDELREEPGSFEPVAEDSDPERELIHRQEEVRLQELIGALEPRLRLVVQLRYDDGLELGEIAGILRVSNARAKECLAEAAAELRSLLERKSR